MNWLTLYYTLSLLGVTGPASEWLPALTAVANIGFSVIVAWYLLARAIPDMQSRFSEDLRAERDSSEKIMGEQRDDFYKTMVEQRNDFHAAILRERESMRDMLAMIQKSETEVNRRNAEKIDRILGLFEDYIRANGGGRQKA